jgi:hypothetical protein
MRAEERGAARRVAGSGADAAGRGTGGRGGRPPPNMRMSSTRSASSTLASLRRKEGVALNGGDGGMLGGLFRGRAPPEGAGWRMPGSSAGQACVGAGAARRTRLGHSLAEHAGYRRGADAWRRLGLLRHGVVLGRVGGLGVRGWRVVGSAAGRALRGVRDACALERAGDPRSSRHSQDERADPAAGPSACGGGGRGTSMGAQHPPPSLSRPRPRPRSRELACPIATGVPRTTPREQPAANPGSRAPP